jgi:hypothetical protein
MSVLGWIRQQEGEPQITQITQMARLPRQGARLEALSLQPAFAFFAFFAVPLTCVGTIACVQGPLKDTVKQRSALSAVYRKITAGCGDLES